jgi:hypothetical protein
MPTSTFLLKRTASHVLAAVTLIAAAILTKLHAHEHLAAGATAPTPGSELLFVNASVFAAESGYVVSLNPDTTGSYDGTHYANLTFITLAATLDYGGPVPFHPALGSRVEAVLESVDGPAGGRVGFWESVDDTGRLPVLTFDLPVGVTNGVHRFPVSENDGSAGSDPYGHVHGRVFSATLPGLYKVGFRFIDTSTLGPDGGPLHEPSARFHLWFQAGVTLGVPVTSNDGMSVTFGTQSGFFYQVEGASDLTAENWAPLSERLAGTDRLQTVTVTLPSEGIRFYRLRRDAE